MAYRGTSQINSNRKVIDMSNYLMELQPAETPVYVVLNRLAKKAATFSEKKEWLEDSYLARYAVVDGAVADSATAVVVTSVEGIGVNDKIKNTATGEVMLVTAINTGTLTLTITRAYGTTAAAAIADEASLAILGNNMAQGSGAPDAKYKNVLNKYNYTEIIKTPFDVTGTLNAMKLYGKKEGQAELARLRAKKGEEHKRDIEMRILFGELKVDAVGDQPRYSMRGIYADLDGTANDATISKADAAFETKLEAWLQGCFTYGSKDKFWLASPDTIAAVNALGKSKLQLMQSDSDTKYGLSIMKYQTPFGIARIVQHPLFTNGYAGLSMMLDTNNLMYYYLRGRDTAIKTNIQNNDSDAIREQYLTEATMMLKHPETHGMLTLT